MNTDKTPGNVPATANQPNQLGIKKENSVSDNAGAFDRLISSIPEKIRKSWFWFLAYIFNVAYFIFSLINANVNRADDIPFTIPMFPGIIFTCIIFIQIFADPIDPIAPEGLSQAKKEEAEKKRTHQRYKWMIFAYSFMMLSLLLTFYPFISSFDKPGETETYRDRPISVFVGCSLDSKVKHLSCFKTESENSDPNRTVANSKPSDSNKPPEHQESKESAADPQQAVGAWIVNIGGYVNKCSNKNSDEYGKAVTCEVNGGLLVPLYFVILALMGGSISLTRRLPELQKQAGSEHIATEKQPKLTQYEFREHLIFQIVQFISAPFLAILAYYLIEPSNTTNSVALAFTAGFASETILLMVRSIANKITPEISGGAQYGAIAGVITLNDKGTGLVQPAQKVEVSLSESPQISSITDEGGFYLLGNVPVGEHSISIKYRVMVNGAEVEKLKKDTVKIDRAQAIVKKNVTILAEDSIQK